MSKSLKITQIGETVQIDGNVIHNVVAYELRKSVASSTELHLTLYVLNELEPTMLDTQNLLTETLKDLYANDKEPSEVLKND